MLHEKLQELIAEQERLGGIDIRKLEVGTKVEVTTKNNTYTLTILTKTGGIYVEGGVFQDNPRKAHLAGSTWGGSMIKTGWIGKDMKMEIHLGNAQVITTSSVQKATIIGKDWSYQMEWQDDRA